MLFIEWVVYFLLYSFIGWTLDSLERSRENRRWTPALGFPIPLFAPIYGFGALFVLLTFPQLKTLPLGGQFLIYSALLGYFEYVGSAVSDRVTGRKLWDYSKNRFNLDGRTDLTHALAWGILALALVHFIHPLVARIA